MRVARVFFACVSQVLTKMVEVLASTIPNISMLAITVDMFSASLNE